MKIRWPSKIFFLLIMVNRTSFSLEIDEKLTLKILSISSTQKTILINRGLEDGLFIGDHAKFFVTTGMIARGVVIKAAPTRSVWSIYRFIDKKGISVGNVMNLKISTAVKITEDESRKIVYQRNQIKKESLSISKEMKKNMNLDHVEGKNEIPAGSESGMDHFVNHGSFLNRTLEFWTGLNLQKFTGKRQITMGITEKKQEPISSTVININSGFEKYFRGTKKSFIDRFSIGGIFRYTLFTSPVTSPVETNDSIEFGITGSWHFINTPFDYSQFISFLQFTYGVGRISETASDQRSLSGTMNFYSGGIGLKYYFPTGFGMRLLLNYSIRIENFAFDDEIKHKKNFNGPHLDFGLAYRW